jgi:uncharacterized protein (DUF433 family)
MAAISTEYIEIDAQGNAKITGSRTKVKQIIKDQLNGLSPEEIHDAYPHLTLAVIHAALAYYYDHRAEIDAQIADDVREYEQALEQQHVHRGITQGLRRRGVDVLTVQQDGRRGAADVDLLDRAMALGRVIFTQDEDFLRHAAHRQSTGQAFAGVIFAEQTGVSIGQCIDDLEIIALASDPDDFVGRVCYLPL